MNFADQRVLVHTPATLAAQFVDQDGEPDDPAGAVTVGITTVDGAALVVGQPTVTPADSPQGTRTFTLTAAQLPELDRLECTWTAASGEIVVTHVDVVGGYYFSLADLKALDGMSSMSIDQLRAARQFVEEMVERRTGWCWVPRLVTETVPIGRFGSPRSEYLTWPTSVRLSQRPFRALRSVSVDGVADVPANWIGDELGVLASTLGWTATTTLSSLVTIVYEVGDDRPPRQLVASLLDAARRDRLESKSGVSPRAIGVTNEFGNVSYARATAENLFGIPAIDAVLAFWDRHMPVVA